MVPRFVLIGLAFLAAGCANSNDPADSSRPAARGNAASSDAARLQGRWEQQPEEGPAASPRQRVVKEISGEAETVTTFAADGKVLHAQSARFRLSERGGVPVYTFYDRRITAGTEQGKREPAAQAFVYRLRGDQLEEVWGLLPGQEEREVVVKRWKRAGR